MKNPEEDSLREARDLLERGRVLLANTNVSGFTTEELALHDTALANVTRQLELFDADPMGFAQQIVTEENSSRQ